MTPAYPTPPRTPPRHGTARTPLATKATDALGIPPHYAHLPRVIDAATILVEAGCEPLPWVGYGYSMASGFRVFGPARDRNNWLTIAVNVFFLPYVNTLLRGPEGTEALRVEEHRRYEQCEQALLAVRGWTTEMRKHGAVWHLSALPPHQP